LNLSTLFIKSNDLKKFKKILTYYFFKNKINLIVCLDFSFFKFIQIIKNLNLIKIAVIGNKEISHNFHYFYVLNAMDRNLILFIHYILYGVLIEYFNKKNLYKSFKILNSYRNLLM
jgi:hypothetical protein